MNKKEIKTSDGRIIVFENGVATVKNSNDNAFDAVKNLKESQIDNDVNIQKYLKSVYNQIKLDNDLAGEFTVYGEYKIDRQVADSLIKLPKKIEKKDGLVMTVVSVMPKLVFTFQITFQFGTGMDYAKLEIVETDKRIGQDTIYHTTMLDEFVSESNPQFLSKVFKRWNVWSVDEDGATLEYNEFLEKWNASFAHLRDRLALDAKKETQFVVKMMKDLQESGEKGESIFNKIKEIVQEMKLEDPHVTKNPTLLKKILDQVLICSGGYKALLTNEVIRKDISLLSGEVLQTVKQTEEIVAPTQKKVEEKKEQDREI